MEEEKKEMPMWVSLAFANFENRKSALKLMWACAVFTIYCFPWVLYFKESEIVSTLLLIDDWSWIAMMLPMNVWYWYGLKWIDKNGQWADVDK